MLVILPPFGGTAKRIGGYSHQRPACSGDRVRGRVITIDGTSPLIILLLNGGSMACYHPLVLHPPDNTSTEMIVPCGQCIGCKLDKSIMWMVRCDHEMQDKTDSTFLTLTYDDDHLPLSREGDPTLCSRDVILFLKRVRKNSGKRFRYFLCGEYGDRRSRPHYHVCMFGFKYDDEVFDSMSRSGFPLFISEKLSRDWSVYDRKIGRCTSQEFTSETAAYCARYCTKKISGVLAETHYGGREPEFATMSRRPGIGKLWFERYFADVMNNDCVIIKNGVKVKTPRYYTELFKGIDKLECEEILRKRKERGKLMFEKSSYKRRIDKRNLKEYVKRKKLKRKFEEEL